MEIIELAKELFQGNEIRIFGTIDMPKFLANDVAKILDIKNVRTSISKFEDYKKCDVRIMDTTGRMQTMTALTEPGLYALVLKSKKPIAKEFEKWVLTEVLPTIRNSGKYNIQDTIDKQKLEMLENENKELKQMTMNLPPITYHQVDINEFIDKSVIYLLHITDYDYKFGVTGDIEKRLAAHKTDFKKLGFDINIVNLWKCESANIMSSIEKMIKNIANQNKMLIKKYDKTEIINTGDISKIVDKINEYVSDKNIIDSRYFELESKRLDKEIIDSKNENLRLKLKLKELKFETRKYKDNKNCTKNNMLENNKLLTNLDINDNIYYSDEELPEFDVVEKDNAAEIQKWIESNPPSGEKTGEYYDKYKKSNGNNAVRIQKFSKYMVDNGYKQYRVGSYNVWKKQG
ncbi:hypothetical protein PV-S19_0438 [Pacmanvirus S19]|nr:hypothetical protein PV-S19_0438 [Pacmanvirus S19]